MREHKAVMDAGRERTFSPGIVYELPDGLAQQWCASGAAAVPDDVELYDVTALGDGVPSFMPHPRRRAKR